MNMWKKMLIPTVLGWAALAAAATVKVPAAPSGDGMLIDTDADGIADQVKATAQEGDAREIRVGRAWGSVSRVILEFVLPEKEIKVKRAVLSLYLNGKWGCYPEKAGASGPETALWYYLAPEANNAVELTDDGAGKKLGTFLPARPVKSVNVPVTCDVTDAVRAAVAAKSPFLGFRLEADKTAEGAWRFRTSEFAEKYGKNYAPLLTIETE